MSVEGSRPSDYLGHIPFDIENYPVAPSTLQLEQIFLFVRHGAFRRPFTRALSQSPLRRTYAREDKDVKCTSEYTIHLVSVQRGPQI
jgi:hypothetical protein